MQERGNVKMMKINKKTKVVCTIGPSSSGENVFPKMIEAGMNIVRMNFSHGSFDEHYQKVEITREYEKKLGVIIPLMLDTKGPEIRTHNFENGEQEYFKGDKVKIYSDHEVLGNRTQFSVTYKALYEDCKIGDEIRLDDGNVGFKVLEKLPDEHCLLTECLNNHSVKDERGVNCPDTHLNMPYISPKDEADLVWGCETAKVDYISASFIRNKKDIEDIRNVLAAHGGKHIKIISKVENTEAIAKLDEIVKYSDGIMVARGDMGVEIPAWDVPVVQRKLIEMCRKAGKPVITATQMLDSMKHNPNPTRAEVSDVANAVLQGSDGVMLSAESANGEYPVESAGMEAKISETMEKYVDYKHFLEEGWTTSDHSIEDSIAYSAASTALLGHCKLIVSFSKDGKLSRRVSRFVPACPVINVSTNRVAATNACMAYAVYSVIENKLHVDLEGLETLANKYALEVGVEKGSDIVIITDRREGEVSNLLKVIKVK